MQKRLRQMLSSQQASRFVQAYVAQSNILSLLKTLEKWLVLFCMGNSTGRRSNVNFVDSTAILECHETRQADRLH